MVFEIRREPVERPDPLDYRFTWVLIVASAVLTVRMHTGYDLDVLMVRHDRVVHEPWRLLSSCLLHGNALHLLFNLFWTWRLGQVLEPILGLVPMAGACLLIGAASSAAQYALSAPGIGLSGILYGIFGMLWAMNRYAPSYRGVMDDRTAQMMAVWFFICIGLTWTGTLPIANVAHGVGALMGGLLGLMFAMKASLRWTGGVGSAVLLAVIGVLASVGRPHVNWSETIAFEQASDGYEAILDKDYARARELLEAAVERRPNFAGAWHNLAYVYHRLGRYDEARAAGQEAERLRRLEGREGEKARRGTGFEFLDLGRTDEGDRGR